MNDSEKVQAYRNLCEEALLEAGQGGKIGLLRGRIGGASTLHDISVAASTVFVAAGLDIPKIPDEVP